MYESFRTILLTWTRAGWSKYLKGKMRRMKALFFIQGKAGNEYKLQAT